MDTQSFKRIAIDKQTTEAIVAHRGKAERDNPGKPVFLSLPFIGIAEYVGAQLAGSVVTSLGANLKATVSQ